jgi:transcriptional regulator with XRE-family HTH domain
VLELLRQGLSNEQIAERLGITLRGQVPRRRSCRSSASTARAGRRLEPEDAPHPPTLARLALIARIAGAW